MSIAEDKGGGHWPALQKFGKGGGTEIKVPNREKKPPTWRKSLLVRRKKPPPTWRNALRFSRGGRDERLFLPPPCGHPF